MRASLLATVARHSANAAQIQNVVNVILIVAAIVLGVIAALKLLGANILPKAQWWQVALAALIFFIIWYLW